MKKIYSKLSFDKKSIFIKANNAVINKTAIISLENSNFLNFLIEKEDNKNILYLQTNSELIEMMVFNNIEDAIEVKNHIEKKLYHVNFLDNMVNISKKLFILSLFILLFISIPIYSYYKIKQISLFNDIVSFNKSNSSLLETNIPNNNHISEQQNQNISLLQKRLIELSKKSPLTNNDREEINKIKYYLLKEYQNTNTNTNTNTKTDTNTSVINNNESRSKNEQNDIIKIEQDNLNRMLNEIKEKSFKKT